jgi:synaptic vesicle membrane protein VAT-1
MDLVVIHEPGGYERLTVETRPDPSPGAGQIRVRTRACGVNYADVVVRWGLYESATTYVGWPITPGFEFSGIVDAVGAGVNRFREGDAVFGVTRFGGYATHVVVPEHQLFALPSRLDPLQAAAFPAVYMTAYHALFQNVVLRPGMTVLVHSAAGGVGTALLQLGKIAGCTMVGVVGSAHKIATARTFGADYVIDKSQRDLWADAESISRRGYDVVLDANGVSTLRQSYDHLAPTGKLIAYGFHSMLPRTGGTVSWGKLAWDYLRTPRFNPIHMTNENRSVVTFNLSFLFDRVDLLEEGIRDLLRWLQEGRVAALPVKAYPLRDVAHAHRDLESGQTTGKLVLVTD